MRNLSKEWITVRIKWETYRLLDSVKKEHRLGSIAEALEELLEGKIEPSSYPTPYSSSLPSNLPPEQRLELQREVDEWNERAKLTGELPDPPEKVMAVMPWADAKCYKCRITWRPLKSKAEEETCPKCGDLVWFQPRPRPDEREKMEFIQYRPEET